MVQPCRLVIGLRSINLEHDLEGDTIDTINAYLKDNKAQYQEFNRHSNDIVGDNADLPETVDVTEETIGTPTPVAAPAPAKRGRKSKAAVEAVAPPPIPVPDAAPPAPPVPAPVDTGIPAFLDRTATATAVAPPPPMVAPPAPVAPASPPVGVLAAKVAAELKKRGEGDAVREAGLVTWLSDPTVGMCVPGATFQEAVDCVLFLSDEKLEPVAKALELI